MQCALKAVELWIALLDIIGCNLRILATRFERKKMFIQFLLQKFFVDIGNDHERYSDFLS